MNKCADYRQELWGYWSLTHCQYFGRNNILRIVMSSGRRSERRGEQARSKAATRVRCETGNPRRGAPAAATPGAARTPGPRPPRTRIYSSSSSSSSPPFPFPLSCDIFSNRKMKCKPSFAAGGPGSPLSDSGSRSGMRCPRRC